MDTNSTYDAMAGRYLHGKTTTLFRYIQSGPIRKFMDIARRDSEYRELNILIVGPGPHGNVEEWVNQVTMKDASGSFIWPFEEIDPSKVTYLDNSSVILDACKQYVETETKNRTGNSGGQFIFGAGEQLDKYVETNYFDIVLGALCDHIDPKKFFRSTSAVLKQGGALITSYPADGINRVVREQIYQIPPTCTRFMVDGVPHLVPSTLVTTDTLRSLYNLHGYVGCETVAVSAGKIKATETIRRAANLETVDPQQAPLVVVGFGRKCFGAQTRRA